MALTLNGRLLTGVHRQKMDSSPEQGGESCPGPSSRLRAPGRALLTWTEPGAPTFRTSDPWPPTHRAVDARHVIVVQRCAAGVRVAIGSAPQVWVSRYATPVHETEREGEGQIPPVHPQVLPEFQRDAQAPSEATGERGNSACTNGGLRTATGCGLYNQGPTCPARLRRGLGQCCRAPPAMPGTQPGLDT